MFGTKQRYKHRKSFRDLKEFDNHEMVIGVTDEETGFKGYIAIHNTNLGPALGGTRLQHYPSEEAALRDVLNLSKAMSYKCALAGLPWGGGKAVLFAQGNVDREAMMGSYARAVEKLNGLFKTGTDLGVFDDDVKKMALHTKHVLGVSEANRGDLTTSKMAALGVFYCIKTLLDYRSGNQSVKNVSVGIKGIGKLGSHLMDLLYKEGARVVIADIDDKKCHAALKKYPKIKVVEPDKIHSEDLDIYSPCALGRELGPRIIKDLKVKIVAGGANNQLVSERDGDKLFEKGILYAPDYVTNAGGLIYVADELEPDGFQKDRVLKRVKGIQKTLKQILEISERKHIATHRISNEVGLKRFLEGKL